MKKFILKTSVYIVLILVMLEMLIRLFHLYTEDPPRIIDEYGVEKRKPDHNGYSVTGNRNQNFSEFNINKEGFNSYREYNPTENKIEVAIIGDSFIEGFHQDYNESIGKKIEESVPDIEVYEYGYAGYDLANQLHLIKSYKEQFKLIDVIVIYLNYESDLSRSKYTPNTDRVAMLSSNLFKIRDNIKLLSFTSKIGVLDPVKAFITGKAFTEENEGGYQTNEVDQAEKNINRDFDYLNNFISLVDLYGYDKSKTVLLLDSRKTSSNFLAYCDANNYRYIDFANTFENSKKPTTLIYDWHWNNHGRTLIAQLLSNYLKSKPNLEINE